MRIRTRLVTKLFIFCFISIGLIVGAIGYGALAYVSQSAVNQYAESRLKTIQISRDAVDLQLGAIRSLMIQMTQHQDIRNGLHVQHADACQSTACDLRFGHQISPALTSLSGLNKYMMIVFAIGLTDPVKALPLLKEPFVFEYPAVKFTNRSQTSDITGFTFSNRNIPWLNQMAASKQVVWVPSQISAFSFGLDDTLLIRDEKQQIRNSGYLSPTFTVGFPVQSEGKRSILIGQVSTHLFRDLMGQADTFSKPLVLDGDNRTIYDLRDERIGQVLSLEPGKMLQRDSGYMTIRMDQEEQLITFSRSKVNGWMLLNITPVSLIPTYEWDAVLLLIIGLTGFIAVVSLMIAIFAKRVIEKPILSLTDAIASVEHGATEIRRVQMNTSDEIGALGRTMNFVADLLDQVKEQTVLAQQNRDQVQYLLDHSGHGILTFGADLRIHTEFSSEMHYIYRKTDFIGRDFAEITFPDAYVFCQQIFHEVFSNGDGKQQDTYLSLLPTEVKMAYHTYQLEYKMIRKSNQPACMVIFTDITDQRALEMKLDQEARAMKMIVKAVQNRTDVLHVISAYQRFAMAETMIWLSGERDLADAFDHLFRQVHTFKGSFAQFQFVHIGVFLHRLEDQMTGLADRDFERSDLERLLNPDELLQAIKPDEAILKEALGDDFFQNKRTFAIAEEALESLAEDLMNRTIPSERNYVIRRIAQLRQRPFHTLMETYPAFVAELAAGLEKFIHPLEIRGGDTLVDPARYAPFTQSLVHVFRNMLDHGIETIDERAESNKEEWGRITCEITDASEQIILRIADDGRGIDRQRIIGKAIEKGLCRPAEADAMTPEQVIEFIFADDFSTKDEITELSGRGVGMAAVKAEVEKIGGAMEVISAIGMGSTFVFKLPK